jgi:hypothetical protein
MLNLGDLRGRAKRTTQSKKSDLKSVINVLNHLSAILTGRAQAIRAGVLWILEWASNGTGLNFLFC